MLKPQRSKTKDRLLEGRRHKSRVTIPGHDIDLDAIPVTAGCRPTPSTISLGGT